LFAQNVTRLTMSVKGDNRNMVRLSNILYVCFQNVIGGKPGDNKYDQTS
jgi:hypothetical protein